MTVLEDVPVGFAEPSDTRRQADDAVVGAELSGAGGRVVGAPAAPAEFSDGRDAVEGAVGAKSPGAPERAGSVPAGGPDVRGPADGAGVGAQGLGAPERAGGVPEVSAVGADVCGPAGGAGVSDGLSDVRGRVGGAGGAQGLGVSGRAGGVPAADGVGVDARGRVAGLGVLRGLAVAGPAAGSTGAQHARGKLTARERIGLLLDEGSFCEVGQLRRHRASGFGLEGKRPYTDGVVTGWGTVEGRQVFVYAHDFRIFGGALGEAHAEKIHRVMDMAVAAGAPLVSLNDGAGARIQEGVSALAGYGGIFRRNTRASGVIPQISVMLGPCAGGAAYSPALTDFVFMVRGTSQMFITGPDVVRAVTGEEVTQEGLGGADVHAGMSGVCHFAYDDEETCLAEVRYLLSLLPQNNRSRPPEVVCTDPVGRRSEALLDLVPVDGSRPYDVTAVIGEIVDDGEFLEVHEGWAGNVVCALARLDGRAVGIVASQPQVLAGVLDMEASQKAAGFVQLCDAFNVPIVTLVDVPGFLPGVDQEHGGIIRHGAKLLYAYCNATVPRIQVILRKAYGGAYIVMDSQSIGADLTYAWPSNEIAVMGAEGAAGVIFRRQIAEADDPVAMRERMVKEYTAELMHPYYAVERGLVDDVIDPAATREVLISSLAMLRTKHADLPSRKHGNPPQ